MKLHFHGNTYEDNHTELPVSEGQVGGRYRGTPWKILRVMQKQELRHSSSDLKYRGVSYHKE